MTQTNFSSLYSERCYALVCLNGLARGTLGPSSLQLDSENLGDVENSMVPRQEYESVNLTSRCRKRDASILAQARSHTRSFSLIYFCFFPFNF